MIIPLQASKMSRTALHLSPNMYSRSARAFAAKVKPVRSLEAIIKKKTSSAVYGSGLHASGCLAVPQLVVNEKRVTSKESKKPVRIPHFNIREIKKVSAGFGFSLFASANKLYGAGLNNRYQISTQLPREGTGQEYYVSAKRIALPDDSKIVSISSGRAHSLIATENGVYAFGENSFGQCGRNPEEVEQVVGSLERPLPLVHIPSDSPVVQVHCSLDSSFLLTASGEVFAFGLNEDGQCANGAYGIQWKPNKISGDAASDKITCIGGSSDTITALSHSGDVFIWGQCEYGQAAESCEQIQVTSSRRIPLSLGRIVGFSTSSTGCVSLNVDGVVHVWGVGVLGHGPKNQRLNRPTPMDLPLFDNEKIDKIFAGNTSFAAVNKSGRAFMWGQNRFGMLGLGHEKVQFFPYQIYLPSDVKDLSLGPDHSLFLVK